MKLLPFLMGTGVMLVQPSLAHALTASQVQQVARGVTVLIDGINPGSGVIVARDGNTYTVLTARHVVGSQDEYTVVTHGGDRYPLDYRRIRFLPGVDLALLSFTSPRSYPVATLANYPYDTRFRNVLTAGWLARPRQWKFTAGLLGDRSFALAMTQEPQPQGYDLFYSNLTEVGMSGGAVLDLSGRVIGIHGRSAGEQIRDSQQGTVRVKRGFSSGIPIATFLRLLPRVSPALRLQVDNTPPSPVTTAELNSIRPFLTVDSLPANASAADWTNRGNQLYRVGQLQDALAALDQAVQIQPDFYPAWYERGNVLFAMRRSTEALASYDRTIQLKPDFHPVWRDRGVLLVAFRQPQPALNSFDRAIALKSDDHVLWYMRGNLLSKDFQQYAQAIASYDRALQLKPDFADAFTGKGKALHQLGQNETALATLDRALQLNPQLAVAWIVRAETLAALNRRQEAIFSLQSALRLRPNDAQLQRMLATLQAQ